MRAHTYSPQKNNYKPDTEIKDKNAFSKIPVLDPWPEKLRIPQNAKFTRETYLRSLKSSSVGTCPGSAGGATGGKTLFWYFPVKFHKIMQVIHICQWSLLTVSTLIDHAGLKSQSRNKLRPGIDHRSLEEISGSGIDCLEIGLRFCWQCLSWTHRILGELIFSGGLVGHCLHLLLYGTGWILGLKLQDIRRVHVHKRGRPRTAAANALSHSGRSYRIPWVSRQRLPSFACFDLLSDEHEDAESTLEKVSMLHSYSCDIRFLLQTPSWSPTSTAQIWVFCYLNFSSFFVGGNQASPKSCSKSEPWQTWFGKIGAQNTPCASKSGRKPNKLCHTNLHQWPPTQFWFRTGELLGKLFFGRWPGPTQNQWFQNNFHNTNGVQTVEPWEDLHILVSLSTSTAMKFGFGNQTLQLETPSLP